MAKNTLSVLFFLCSIQCLSIVGVNARLVPALYIFGDSLSDAGNNIFLPGAKVKANFKPYAIDFPNRTFGRFTNGFTMADYLAFSLRLPIQSPVLDPHSQTKNCTDGFNYASSSAGILPDTGIKIAGANLCLGRQVQLFKKTTQEFLVSQLRNQHAITRHKRNSIYLIQIGSNDYTLNYIDRTLSNNSQKYNAEQFAELLVNELGRQVQELYRLGARKFVVSEIGPLGCTPRATMIVQSLTRCVDQVNHLVSFFNLKLADKITQLSKTLKAATFVTIKADLLAQLMEYPERYGFEDAANPCCAVKSTGFECEPDEPPIDNRRASVFFDGVHTTDAVNKLIAKECFKGIGVCTPINIRQLVKQR